MLEASGSLTAAYLIKAVREAGHFCVASDVDGQAVGRYLADDFALMPPKDDPALWDKLERIVEEKGIDVVIPSLDETLLGWAQRRQKFHDLGVHVILSDAASVGVCQDKWLTSQFLKRHNIPTPETSLEQRFPLVKPRAGRGGIGVRVEHAPIPMEGMISQEVLDGVEYTVDVFCDRDSRPVYIVPRRRGKVREGKSTSGVVEAQPAINHWVEVICSQLRFMGPINIQCFLDADGRVKVVEINPRIAGGMALSLAATENWVAVAVRHFIEGLAIAPKPIIFGLAMHRYYAEVFISPH